MSASVDKMWGCPPMWKRERVLSPTVPPHVSTLPSDHTDYSVKTKATQKRDASSFPKTVQAITSRFLPLRDSPLRKRRPCSPALVLGRGGVTLTLIAETKLSSENGQTC